MDKLGSDSTGGSMCSRRKYPLIIPSSAPYSPLKLLPIFLLPSTSRLPLPPSLPCRSMM
ncbi:hypothetical protein IC582_024405 [Cucumis melo]